MNHVQGPLCMGFSSKNTGVGSQFPSPGDLPNPGIKSGSPGLQVDSLPTELGGNLLRAHTNSYPGVVGLMFL